MFCVVSRKYAGEGPEVCSLHLACAKQKAMSRRIYFILLAGILSFAAIPAGAQDEPMNMPAPCTSSVQSYLWGPRFEVLMTPEAVPGIFKIDKYTGDVWVLPNSIGSSNKLRKFTRETSFEDEIIEGQINYQLIVISTSKAYLLNLNSGVMWEYSEELFRTSRSFRLMEERF